MSVLQMKLSRKFRQTLKEKWFLAGFGYRQDIELTGKLTVELKVNDSLHGKTTVRVIERMKSGNELTRYQFECHLSAQAFYRLQHLQPRQWRLDSRFNAMTEYNASDLQEVTPC